MIMLFGALMICQLIFGDKRTRAILGIVEIPVGLLNSRSWTSSDYEVVRLRPEIHQHFLHSILRASTP